MLDCQNLTGEVLVVCDAMQSELTAIKDAAGVTDSSVDTFFIICEYLLLSPTGRGAQGRAHS